MAAGAPIHYASPRLRREGGEGTNTLATDFLHLIKQVSQRRQKEVMELQRNLDESQERNLALSQRVHLLEAQIQENLEKSQRNEQTIREY